jgi:hypothetical protein
MVTMGRRLNHEQRGDQVPQDPPPEAEPARFSSARCAAGLRAVMVTQLGGQPDRPYVYASPRLGANIRICRDESAHSGHDRRTELGHLCAVAVPPNPSVSHVTALYPDTHERQVPSTAPASEQTCQPARGTRPAVTDDPLPPADDLFPGRGGNPIPIRGRKRPDR